MNNQTLGDKIKQLEHQVQAAQESEGKSRAVGRAAGNERMFQQTKSRKAVLDVLARQLSAIQQHGEYEHRDEWIEFYTLAIASVSSMEMTAAEVIFTVINEWVTIDLFLPQAMELLQSITGDNEPLDKYIMRQGD